MTVEIEEGRMDDLATAPVFTKEERTDATNPFLHEEERNRIQNLREQRLMDMLEHICIEVSNMSKAIQNLSQTQQPKPDLQPKLEIGRSYLLSLEERLSKLELRVASIGEPTVTLPVWPPKGHPAPPTPSYDPNYRRPRISDTDPYDPANYNTGFTGFGK